MVTKAQIARRQLGLKDSEYYAILDARYGVESSTKLSVPQLHDLLLYFQTLGWQAKRGSAKRGARRDPGVAALLAGDAASLGREALMEKIEALLAEKGRVEGTHMPWAYAMGILKQQTKGAIRDFRQASPDQLRDVMLALLRDAKRKGRKTR
ncbi:MAG TPA: phage protein GemA/Gp16 family protein [Nitratidesulfovibrio sp.]|nr:phage protein GemA/Gp16 family protein [Nitratidesulfovibrio sp.]